MHTIAEQIIHKLGGHQKVAEITGLDISRIYRWTYEKERGGTNGVIPARHFSAILMAGEKLNINIALNELIPIPKTKKNGHKK